MKMLPRTLILTRWSPTAKYAGGEATRKLVGRLPSAQLRWAYLDRVSELEGEPWPEQHAFPPRHLNWRLRGTLPELFQLHYVQARRLASEIAEWVESFRPEVVWVASDMETISVALHLQQCLRVPLHVTVYDAAETCRIFGMPRGFYPLYIRKVRKLMRGARSFDAVSMELVNHVEQSCPAPGTRERMVLPVSVGQDTVAALPDLAPLSFEGPLRRIGFCGASRASQEQWNTLLRLLGELPWEFEIIAFAQRDHFHQTPPDARVKVLPQSFVPTEADIMARFRECGAHACFLGLTKRADQALFAQTSLSSKLTTYAGTGLPIIADAPRDSVAWRLLDRHGAGIRIGDDIQKSRDNLADLFGNAESWQRMADGTASLCREEFNLERNLKQFQELLVRTAVEN